MSCFQPPFSGAQPGWEDGCGFFIPSGTTTTSTTGNFQRGSFIVPKLADRVTVIFDQSLPLNTPYDISVWTENTKPTGDPDEQIFPSQLFKKNNDGSSEIGFTFMLNAMPSTGPGTFGTNGENSYTQFNWRIEYSL